jgi:hypothetical protein
VRLRCRCPMVARLLTQRVAGEVVRLSRPLHLDKEILSREVLAAVGRSIRRSARSRARSGSRRPRPLDI